MDGEPAQAGGNVNGPGNTESPRPRTSSQSQPQGKPAAAGASDNASPKISNAELKKQKQAEKSARRALAKQSSSPQQGQVGPKAADTVKKPGPSKAPTVSSIKPQHKRTSSAQKVLPARPLQNAEKKPSPAKVPGHDVKKVSLFGHLYGHPRNSTIIGAGKDIHPAVLALGLQMSNYTICGSSARCVASLLAFKRVVESYTTPPGNSLPRHLTSHLNAQIEYLVSCRPLATSMGNAIRWLKVEINNVDPNKDESQAKKDLCAFIDRFILEHITAADTAIAHQASLKIKDGDVLMTFSRSNIVQKTLLLAHEQGRRFRVVVVDSRPLFEGRNAARELTAAGIDVQYTLTHALSHCVSSTSKVLLGAHSMLSNGRLYARVGTALVALMAKTADVPVIVCCESIKFTDRVALDAIVTNEVAPPDELLPSDPGVISPLDGWKEQPNLQLLNLMYDVTPAEYITMVVTEYGSLPPTSVPVVHALSTNT